MTQLQSYQLSKDRTLVQRAQVNQTAQTHEVCHINLITVCVWWERLLQHCADMEFLSLKITNFCEYKVIIQ